MFDEDLLIIHNNNFISIDPRTGAGFNKKISSLENNLNQQLFEKGYFGHKTDFREPDLRSPLIKKRLITVLFSEIKDNKIMYHVAFKTFSSYSNMYDEKIIKFKMSMKNKKVIDHILKYYLEKKEKWLKSFADDFVSLIQSKVSKGIKIKNYAFKLVGNNIEVIFNIDFKRLKSTASISKVIDLSDLESINFNEFIFSIEKGFEDFKESCSRGQFCLIEI